MTDSLRTVIEGAHADWHNEHQAVQFSTLLLTRLAEHGFAVHQSANPDESPDEMGG